jgi:hypothetical protein
LHSNIHHGPRSRWAQTVEANAFSIWANGASSTPVEEFFGEAWNSDQ